jgi:hypothetical protein
LSQKITQSIDSFDNYLAVKCFYDVKSSANRRKYSPNLPKLTKELVYTPPQFQENKGALISSRREKAAEYTSKNRRNIPSEFSQNWEKFVRNRFEILWKRIKNFLQKVEKTEHICLLKIEETDSFLQKSKLVERYFSQFAGNCHQISQKQERIVFLSFPLLDLAWNTW